MSTRNFRISQDMDDWMRDMEKRLIRQERRLGVAAKGTVTDGGNPTTIAASSSWFRNTDTLLLTSDGPDVFTMELTELPRPGSEHVYWGPLWVPPTTWTRTGKLLTVTDGVGLLRTGDYLSCSYAYDPTVQVPTLSAIVPTWRDTAPQNLNGFLMPDGAEVGDLLVLLAMMPNTESVTALNGFTALGASDYVVHAAVGPGTRTYRLEAYLGVNDGLGTLPAVSNVAAQDVVCSTTAFADGAGAVATFDTLADGTTANAPAMSPVSLRAWGTIGDSITITPTRGTTVMSTNYIEIDIAMTIDDDPTAAPANSSGAAGWALASLVVTA